MSPHPNENFIRAFFRATWIGSMMALGAGLLEAWYRWGGEPASRRLPSFGSEFFWIAPAGMVFLSAPILLAVGAIRGLRPTLISFQQMVLGFAILPFLSLSLIVLRERMPDAVHLILALGFASVLARVAASREATVERVARRASPVLLLVPLIALGKVIVDRGPGERSAIARLVPAPDSARNVVLIVWDTVRERELSLYGYHLKTTQRLAGRAAAGVVFNRAHSTAPWTLPSHASLFTGLLPQELEVDWVTPLGRRHPTLAESLAERGFRTAGFTANLGATMRPSGLARGFHHYEDWPVPRRPTEAMRHLTIVRTLRHYWPFSRFRSLQLPWRDAPAITDSFLRWVDDPSDRERPFFAFLNYFNAHEPYRSPQVYRQRFGLDTAQSRYDAAIAFQDDELDRLFKALDERGLLERTVVILTSDHGEAFGEHSSWQHGQTLFLEQLQVPLVLWAPGRAPAGLRISVPVSIRDVPRTVLDLALDPPPATLLGGRSLARFWQTPAAARDTVVAAGNYAPHAPNSQFFAGNGTALIIDGFHYILDGDGGERVYDVMGDPAELTNVAGVDSVRAVVEAFRALLRQRFGSAWSGKVPLAGSQPLRAPEK